jgi:hypothetical protein
MEAAAAPIGAGPAQATEKTASLRPADADEIAFRRDFESSPGETANPGSAGWWLTKRASRTTA